MTGGTGAITPYTVPAWWYTLEESTDLNSTQTSTMLETTVSGVEHTLLNSYGLSCGFSFLNYARSRPLSVCCVPCSALNRSRAGEIQVSLPMLCLLFCCEQSAHEGICCSGWREKSRSPLMSILPSTPFHQYHIRARVLRSS